MSRAHQLTVRVRRQAARLRAEREAARPLTDADRCSDRRSDLTLGMTTFPARLGQVHLALRTLLRQTVKPSSIELVLSRAEVGPRLVPAAVRALQERGVNVRFVPGNPRSYKKLLPILETDPDRTVVTVDDDVLYPDGWLADLVAAHSHDSTAVLGHRGTRIQSRGEAAEPYVTWPRATPSTGPSRTFLTGMGGILYPPGALAPQVMDLGLAQRLCPTADDIWFKAMSLLAGTPTRCISEVPVEFPTVRRAQRHSLRTVNVARGHNDRQFLAVMEHFDLWRCLDA